MSGKHRRGICSVCEKEWALTESGTLRRHKHKGNTCEGSGRSLAEAAEAAFTISGFDEIEPEPLAPVDATTRTCKSCGSFVAGHCHRFPPFLGRQWPIVEETDFCDEWKMKPSDSLARVPQEKR